jgi:hypothetical protein
VSATQKRGITAPRQNRQSGGRFLLSREFFLTLQTVCWQMDCRPWPLHCALAVQLPPSGTVPCFLPEATCASNKVKRTMNRRDGRLHAPISSQKPSEGGARSTKGHGEEGKRSIDDAIYFPRDRFSPFYFPPTFFLSFLPLFSSQRLLVVVWETFVSSSTLACLSSCLALSRPTSSEQGSERTHPEGGSHNLLCGNRGSKKSRRLETRSGRERERSKR